MDSFWIDTALLGMVAGFLIFRLVSVLGRRTGHEPPPGHILGAPGSDEAATGVAPRAPLSPSPRPAAAQPQGPVGAPQSPLAQALAAIRQSDRSFDPDSFITGARQAHEMIATAFAQGDRDTLKSLLDPQIYRSFDAAIRDREAKGWVSDFTYVRLKTAEIVDAETDGRVAEVTARFVCELMSGHRNAEGEIVEGDPAFTRQVTDLWTFARDLKSSDPNWKLVATSSDA